MHYAKLYPSRPSSAGISSDSFCSSHGSQATSCTLFSTGTETSKSVAEKTLEMLVSASTSKTPSASVSSVSI